MTQKKDTVETERVKLVDWGYTVWSYEVSCKEVSLSRCYLVIASLQFYPFDKRERERWRESTIDEKEKACWAKVISWKGDKEREKKERKRVKGRKNEECCWYKPSAAAAWWTFFTRKFFSFFWLNNFKTFVRSQGMDDGGLSEIFG